MVRNEDEEEEEDLLLLEWEEGFYWRFKFVIWMNRIMDEKMLNLLLCGWWCGKWCYGGLVVDDGVFCGIDV